MVGKCLMVLALAAAPHIVHSEFTFPLPAHYHELTLGDSRQRVVIEAIEARGAKPTITFQEAPIAAHIVDSASCSATAASIGAGQGTLKRAALIAGPMGKACQMEIVAAQGVALITELDLRTATWLMTCNFADGDAQAEKICRATLAAFEAK